MHTKYRLILTLFILTVGVLILLSCQKDEGTTIIESGLQIEGFESDKLNALPIIGYMQTGSVLPPALDGSGSEEIWTLTEPFEIATEGGPNGFGPTVTAKALYDNYYLFLLLTWEDDSKSVEKDMWWYGLVGEGDTTYVDDRPGYGWHRISEPFSPTIGVVARTLIDTTSVPPDTQYVYAYEQKTFSGNEDGLAVMWNINSTNFLGCTNLCHGSTMQTDTDEAVDVWFWASHRTNPKGYADDLSLQPTGFQGDSGDSCWTPNVSDDLPAFMDQGEPGRNLTFLHDSTSTATFYATVGWKGSQRIPGHVLQYPTGNRADVRALGVYSSGQWTLEIRRQLDTGVATDTDVQFNPDADANVEFHLAVYDNEDGENHAYSSGTQVLHFLQYVE